MTVLALSGLLAGFSKPDTHPDGVYGIICASAATDDLDGLQVKVATQGDDVTLDILLCEGGCSKQSVFRGHTRLHGSEFEFSTVEHEVEGGTGRHIETPITFSGSFGPNKLTIGMKGAVDAKPVTLMPAKQSHCWRGSSKSAQPLLDGHWPH